MRVLMIDDEPSMRVLVEHIMSAEGYEFLSAEDGKSGLSLIEEARPDLVLLDIMMPGMSGFAVCREMRRRGHVIPVVFLTARDDIVDKAEGFEAGGNDYVVKPFDPQELALRVGAHLRQYKALVSHAGDKVRVGGLELDASRHRVTSNGVAVELTSKEFHVLRLLASRPDEVFTSEQIVSEVWGENYIEGNSSLPVIIRRIRKKVEPEASHPRLVVTVRNVGYKLATGVS